MAHCFAATQFPHWLHVYCVSSAAAQGPGHDRLFLPLERMQLAGHWEPREYPQRFSRARSGGSPDHHRCQVHTVAASTRGGRIFEYNYRWLDKGLASGADSYIFCFYWTLGVLGIMPMEVYPITKAERVYTLVFMFFVFSTFSIRIAKITQMFRSESGGANLRRIWPTWEDARS